MGINLSVASVGTGGQEGIDADVDERAFARLAYRFPETLKAAGEGALRQRFQKTWSSVSRSLDDGSGPNGSSQLIFDARGRAGACVVEIRATDDSLRAMLTMAYDDSDIDGLERTARSLDVTAAEVAFFVSAHESAHCVIGMARRAGLIDTSWVAPGWEIPSSWGEARSEGNEDNPALAKAEENAADLLAVFWAAEAFGADRARQLARLVMHARAAGARSGANDGLHDSSRALAGVLASSRGGRYFPVANAARRAWQAAVLETRREITAGVATQLAAHP